VNERDEKKLPSLFSEDLGLDHAVPYSLNKARRWEVAKEVEKKVEEEEGICAEFVTSDDKRNFVFFGSGRKEFGAQETVKHLFTEQVKEVQIFLSLLNPPLWFNLSGLLPYPLGSYLLQSLFSCQFCWPIHHPPVAYVFCVCRRSLLTWRWL